MHRPFKVHARGQVIARMFEARHASMPRWRGWMPRRYGPNARYRIPRMPYFYWHMEGRALFKTQPGWSDQQNNGNSR